MRKSKVLLITLVILSALFIAGRYYQIKADDVSDTDFLLSNYVKTIENTLQSSFNILYPVESTILFAGDKYSKEKFDQISSSLFDKNLHLFLGYAPHGILTYIYGFNDTANERLGTNVITDKESSHEVKLAMQTGTFTVSPPSQLITGDYAMVIRKPIFKDDSNTNFIGIVSLVVSVNELVNKIGLSELNSVGYKYQLKTINNDSANDVVITQSEDFDDTICRHLFFKVGATTWKLSIYKPLTVLDGFERLSSVILICVLVSIFVYITVSSIEKRNEKVRRELYIDPLTKAKNRKFLSEYLDNNDNKEPFTLFYLDLNDFKPINDSYGHDIGDKLLVAYVERTKGHFKKDTPVIRLGGDEFAVIVKGEMFDYLIESVTDRIDTLSCSAFYIDSHRIEISASIGYANYPEDATTIEELLIKADKKMYNNKSQRTR